MKIDLGKSFKSKTIRGLLVVAVAMVMQMFAITPAEIQQVAPTIDEIGVQLEKTGGSGLETGLNIAEILGLLYAAYGRAVAQQPLLKKKEGNGNEKA